jgi:hypothetical protein
MPFCAECRAWKRKRVLGPYRVEPAAAVQAIAGGTPAAMVVPTEGDRTATLTLYTCPHCGNQGPIDVWLAGGYKVGKQTYSFSVYVTYPGEAEAAFDEIDGRCRAVGLKV